MSHHSVGELKLSLNLEQLNCSLFDLGCWVLFLRVGELHL